MDAFAQFVPIILVLVIFYFLLIRPQQQKMKIHQQMIENLRRGDEVVTQGGLKGKVTKVKEGENEIIVEFSKGVEIHVVRSSVAEVLNKIEPAK